MIDRPDTKADAVIALSTHMASCSDEGDTYLKQHDAPDTPQGVGFFMG